VVLDILVKNVALWGTEDLSDVGIEGGRFVSIDRSPASLISAVTLDAEGRMACRALSNRIFISTRR
jgi:cytosine deaminase